MNPRGIQGPATGISNNASTGIVSLVIAGENPVLTALQAGELDQHFESWKRELSLSLAGYQTTWGKLADGSPYAIESNSGVHTVTVWPVGGVVVPDLSDRFFAVPTSYASSVRTDWNPKYSGEKGFRGATEPPPRLRKARKLTDEPDIRQHPGNLTWFNEDLTVRGRPIVVSWYGRATRYGRLDYYSRQRQWSSNDKFSSLYCVADDATGVGPSTVTASRLNWAQAFKPAVWINGVKHAVRKSTGEDTFADIEVMSAALKHIDDATLELWVVTHDATLAVYKATIKDIYDAKPITVAKQFDIDYTIHTTDYGGFPGYSDSNTYGGLWEGLLQPLYFNASCTKLAGLASVWKPTVVNASAAAVVPASSGAPMYAVLIEVNLLTEVTTFTSGGYVLHERVVVHTGAPVGMYGEAPEESRSTTRTRQSVSYGAVDFVGDQLTIVMVDYECISTFQENGSLTGLDGPDPAAVVTAEKTMTGTVRTKYRVFYAHDNTTLLEKDSGVVNVGIIQTQSSGQEVGGFRQGAESGSRSEEIADELFWAASIEGGDLRHNCLVVGEFVEVGNSTFADSWDRPLGSGSDPAARYDIFGANYMSSFTGRTVTSSGSRLPVLRLVLVKDAAVVHTTPIMGDAARGSYSIFGLIAPDNADPAQAAHTLPWTTIDGLGNISGWWDWLDASANWQTGTWTDIDLDADLMFSFMPRQFRASMDLLRICPHVSCGRPYVNVFAAVPDGSQMFYNIASAHRNAAAVADWDARAAFYIGEDEFVVDASDYHPTGGDDSVLASPVYIHLVPEEA